MGYNLYGGDTMNFFLATAIFTVLMIAFLGTTLFVVFYNTSIHLEQAMAIDAAREINTRAINPRIVNARQDTWNQSTAD